MSHVLATPTPATSIRRFLARVWDDPDSRSTAIGLLGVILVHLLLLLLGPSVLRVEHGPSVLRPHSSAREFNIEIAPDAFVPQAPPKPPEPTQFVETNPDAPENIPDKTNNFGAQNQQVAQEKPTPGGESERPALEGQKDFESTQIVSGTLRKQPEPLPSAPPVPEMPAAASQSAPRAEQNPLPGFEKTDGENPNAFGTNIAPDVANARPVPERVEGERDVPLIEGATGYRPAIDPKRPRPRPTIVKQQQVRPAILAENKLGTANIGVTAINAKFSNYGAYLQRLIEAVQLQWDGMVDEMKAYPPQGSYVEVKFVLNSKGEVASISNVDNHTTTLGERTCVTAITKRSPYGEWTEDMKAVLGEEQELTFTFYYR